MVSKEFYEKWKSEGICVSCGSRTPLEGRLKRNR